MVHESGGLSPQATALATRIRAELTDLCNTFDKVLPGALLFMDDGQPAIPGRVILDPALDPVDKLVWMLLAMQLRNMGGCSAFPDHETLAGRANVSCASSVARAVDTLRLLRWLTECTSVQPEDGKYAGRLHVLHSKPLARADTAHLDRHYLRFVKASCSHESARVRALAKTVLENPAACDDRPEMKKTAVGCSSSDFTTTTTTTTNENSDAACDGFPVPKQSGGTRSPPLVYPPSLAGRRRTLANRYLAAVDPRNRQALLDELQGRLESERRGMRPVYDELRFLHALCRAQRQGRFVANLGIRVMEARQARMQSAAPAVDEAQKAREAKERERARALGRQHLARIRRKLGMKDRAG